MPLYLAYGFEPQELTKNKLARIIDDYFDFGEGALVRTSDDFFRLMEEGIKRFKGVPDSEKYLKGIGETMLEKARYFTYSYSKTMSVKGHPLLNIYFRHKETAPNCGENFTGLSISANHSGSEGMVDMLNFKPEMNGYLNSIGINYLDKSRLCL